MPRIIGTERNEIIFDDIASRTQLGLYYRLPTTKERQGFLNSAVRRIGNKVTMHHAEARMKYGMEILQGVRDGDFMRMENGSAVPMSSNPASPHYFPGWKEEMETGCADLIMAMAGHVFDGTVTLASREDDPDEDVTGE